MVERLGLRLARKVSPLGGGLSIRAADAVYQVPSLTDAERHTLLLGNVPIEYAEVDLLLVVVRAGGEVAIAAEMDPYVPLRRLEQLSLHWNVCFQSQRGDTLRCPSRRVA